MNELSTLLERNHHFAQTYSGASMPILPRLRMVVIACVDARVDPAHVLGLDLGEAVVIRNNGGRVTRAVIDEIAVLAFMVARMTNSSEPAFNIVVIHHTQCGAERFADPAFRAAIQDRIGVNVADAAIHDHDHSLQIDLDRLRDAPELPGHITVAALHYDVSTGRAREIAAPLSLAQARVAAQAREAADRDTRFTRP